MKQGSVIGGALLIAGSCIGAGMLGLPILTGISGFVPSLFSFLIAFCFMLATGFLMCEVAGNFSKRSNILSMNAHLLGRFGKISSWLLYVFLFYALQVAYIVGSGDLFSLFMRQAFGLSVPDWTCGIFFVVLFSWIVFLGTRSVDLFNRWLMVGKVLAFGAILLVGMSAVQPALLAYSKPHLTFLAFPILVISFGFHNMVPTLMSYMDGDLKRVRLSITLGALIVLGIYLVWEVLVLGIVPAEGPVSLLSSYRNDEEASQALLTVLGVSKITTFSSAFAFFAILTSFLAQSLALVHFFADALKVKHNDKTENPYLLLVALLPPLIFSILYPKFFFQSLNFAGGFCAVMLFGLFPCIMCWILRFKRGVDRAIFPLKGKIPLIVLSLVSIGILVIQALNMGGLLPSP